MELRVKKKEYINISNNKFKIKKNHIFFNMYCIKKKHSQFMKKINVELKNICELLVILKEKN